MALPKRKPMRYQGFDYSEFGAYFLTICTHDKEKLFWDMNDVYKRTPKNEFAPLIERDDLPLTKLGKIVEQNLEIWANTYNNFEMIDYVIMPNHIHLLVSIVIDEKNPNNDNPNISRMVAQFKAKVTKEWGKSIWQKSYYDHIIRNEKDFDECLKYIESNPIALEYRILEQRKMLK